MRMLLKIIERSVLAEMGVSMSFASTKLELRCFPMTFGEWKNVCRLAELEDVDSWDALSIMDHDLNRLPKADVIDEALRLATLNAESSDESEDERSVTDHADA